MTIMVEDSGALLGIAIAGIGIFLSNQTGNTTYDSISSLSIGAILMAFAFFLARENKGLLIGEAISRQEYKRIVRLIKEIPEVNRNNNNSHYASCTKGCFSYNRSKPD